MLLASLLHARPLLLVLLLTLNSYAQTPPQASFSEIDDLANTLVTLKSQQEREQLLAKNRALMTPDLRKALIRQGNSQLLAGRYSTAFDIYGVAQNIAEQIGDKEGVATAWLDIGTVYYFQANYPAALEHYKKARDLFTEVTNHYESAKALSGVALIYKEQRRETEALAALQQVLREFMSLGDKEEVANTLNMIGTIYYGQGNYSAAADAYRKLAPLKLEDVSSLIPDTSTALLEYTITETNTYLFVLTLDRTAARTPQKRRQTEINLKVYPLEIRRDELASKVRHFQQLLASRDDNFYDLSRELYKLLQAR